MVEIEISEAIIINVVTLLAVMNPPLQIPISGGLIKGMTKEKRSHCILQAVICAAGILIFFACLGIPFLKHIGISIDSFSVAGGTLLFIIGAQIMTTGNPPSMETEGCIVPIGTPFIAGPGAITVTTLMVQNDPWTVSFFPIVTIVAIIFCLSVTLIILFFSEQLLNLLHKEGNQVVAKIMGIVIAAIGVEYILKGVLGLIGL